MTPRFTFDSGAVFDPLDRVRYYLREQFDAATAIRNMYRAFREVDYACRFCPPSAGDAETRLDALQVLQDKYPTDTCIRNLNEEDLTGLVEYCSLVLEAFSDAALRTAYIRAHTQTPLLSVNQRYRRDYDTLREVLSFRRPTPDRIHNRHPRFGVIYSALSNLVQAGNAEGGMMLPLQRVFYAQMRASLGRET